MGRGGGARHIGFVECELGHFSRARPRLEEALAQAQRVSDKNLESLVHAYLGALYASIGDTEAARDSLRRGRDQRWDSQEFGRSHSIASAPSECAWQS